MKEPGSCVDENHFLFFHSFWYQIESYGAWSSPWEFGFCKQKNDKGNSHDMGILQREPPAPWTFAVPRPKKTLMHPALPRRLNVTMEKHDISWRCIILLKMRWSSIAMLAYWRDDRTPPKPRVPRCFCHGQIPGGCDAAQQRCLDGLTRGSVEWPIADVPRQQRKS